MSTRRQVFHSPRWKAVTAPAQLPNVLGATVQSDQLEVGDTCYVLAPTSALYVCTTRTLGAAVWVPLSPAAALPPVGAKISVARAAATTIAPATSVPIVYTAVTYDENGTVITQPTLNVGTGEVTITGPTPAYYEISARVEIDNTGTPTPTFTMAILVDAVVVARGAAGDPRFATPWASIVLPLAAGQVVTVEIQHDSLDPQDIGPAGLILTQVF